MCVYYVLVVVGASWSWRVCASWQRYIRDNLQYSQSHADTELSFWLDKNRLRHQAVLEAGTRWWQWWWSRVEPTTSRCLPCNYQLSSIGVTGARAPIGVDQEFEFVLGEGHLQNGNSKPERSFGEGRESEPLHTS